MYEGFYGLKTDPFRLSADHRFCYNHRSYARAKAYVQYALYRAEGFVLVTGRPGTGKTTLVNDLLATLPNKEVVAGTLVSTQLEAEDLLLMAGHAFGLEFESAQKALVLQRLIEYFKEQHAKGLRTLLIIDEAQDLASSALEELRLLTNLQYEGSPLLQIALLGQDALRDIVRTPEMEQVHQRLIASWQLEPLTPEETVGYVRHRLQFAGWEGDPALEPGVLEAVYRFSHGVPRRINLICSRLLLHGFVERLHSISVADAETVIRELHREELALPDYEEAEEGGGSGGRATGSVRREPRAVPDEAVWKEIDVGLFGPGASAGSESPEQPSVAPMSAEPVEEVKAAPSRSARAELPPDPEKPKRASEPRAAPALKASPDPVPAAARSAGTPRARASDALEPVIPMHIVPERDDTPEDTPRRPREMPWWRGWIGARSGLMPWVAVLVVVWLVLLAVFLMRDADETAGTGSVQQLSGETGQGGAVAGPTNDVSVPGDDETATPDPGAPGGSGVATGGEAEPAARVTAPVPGPATDGDPVPQDGPLLFGRIFFGLNSTAVGTEFAPLLDEAAELLMASGDARAEVIGYTDRFGNLDYNLSLSRQRARSVANQLIGRGVAAEQLVVEGQGPRDPGEAEGLTREEERAVEITVHR